MTPFIRFTTEFNNNQPQFNTDGLDSKQQAFINGCLTTWKNAENMDKPFNLAMVMWKNEQDFCGLIVEVEDPVIAQLEFEATWENAGLEL
jgi:hypothetical protein